MQKKIFFSIPSRSVVELMAYKTGVPGSDHIGGGILFSHKQGFILHSLLLSPFHWLSMTEILLKGCRTVRHQLDHGIFPQLNIFAFQFELVHLAFSVYSFLNTKPDHSYLNKLNMTLWSFHSLNFPLNSLTKQFFLFPTSEFCP